MRLRLLLLPLIAAFAFAGPAMAAKVAPAPKATPGFFESLFGFPAGSGYSAPNYSAPSYGGSAYGDQNYNTGGALYPDEVSPYRVVPAQFRRQNVSYPTSEAPGTIVVDTRAHFLYFILGNNQAIRYGVGVGRTGFGWKGVVHVGDKQVWPGWTPPPQMIARERARGNVLPAFMPGGPDNPLGARALYLYNETGDTGYRIHGTSEPWTIGLDVSSGCVRLNNDDVVDLFQRAPSGAKVIMM
jgi:lipoprotein-anchoring transpeptidase ErfK/SrfK